MLLQCVPSSNFCLLRLWGAIEDSWLSSGACPIQHPAPPRTFSSEAGREALITVEADQGPKSSPVLFAFRFSPGLALSVIAGARPHKPMLFRESILIQGVHDFPVKGRDPTLESKWHLEAFWLF